MTNRFSHQRALGVLAVTLLAACGEPTPVTAPPSSLTRLAVDPRLTLLDPGAPGLIVVCASGGAATFSVSASPATGTLLGGGAFSVADGACANAWTATAGELAPAAITVTQTAGSFGYIEATATPPEGLPYMTVNQSGQTVTWMTNADHGGSATFFQNAAPPPPPPSEGKKVILCKVGPAGTYSFTVDAVGGTDNVFPSGQSFTIAAGACKDVWTTNTPPIDPIVTVTEGGSAPLDSIMKMHQDSLPVVLTGTRSVSIQVGFDHGGVLTFFNAPVCDDQAATNFGGRLPCEYPPPPPVGKTFTIGPSSMEGHLKIPINSWFNGGYSFKFKNSAHVATQFTVDARVAITVTCPYGGGPGGTILIPLGVRTYNVPAGNTAWLPTGDANNILSWMGAVRTPDLCGGFPMDNARGAVFTATVSQNPVTGVLVDFRFKYRNPAAKGKVDTNCTDPTEPKRNDAATCGASWSQTVTDP